LGHLESINSLPPDQLFAAVVGIILILVLMGLSNRIVVFYDWDDFFITVSPIYTLIGTFFVEAYFGEGTTGANITTTVGSLLAIAAVIWVFISSVRHNGLIIGLPVAILKIVGSLLASIMAIALVGKIFSPDAYNPLSVDRFFSSNFAARIFYIVLFGIFMWILFKMVNGEKVMQRRLTSG